MNNGTGQKNYGLAPPRGERARLNLGSRPAAAAGGWQQPGVAMAPPPMPRYHRPRRDRPLWLWILLGIMVGIGGTLATASLWLPDRGTRITIFEPGADERLAYEQARAPITPSGLESEPVPVSVTETLEAVKNPTDDIDEAAIQSEIDAMFARGEAMLKEAEQALNTEASEIADVEVDAGDSPARSEETVAETSIDEANPSRAGLNPADALRDLITAQQALSEQGIPQSQDDLVGNAAADLSEGETEGGLQQIAAVDAERLTDEVGDGPPAVTVGADSNGRLYRVQLAAVDNQNAASAFWREVNERLPGVFADIEPIFDERLVDERIYLRIWVGQFGRRADALGYCGWLKEKGQDCFVTRVDQL